MKAYRLLLHLFPKSFRIEYGDEMTQLFEDRRRGAVGVGGVSGLWLETLMDVIPNAARVHLDILRQDLGFTLRALGRAPGFTFTAVVVAALGVGATTAAFSVTDRALIRPLPFKEPDRLVKIFQSEPGYSRFEPSPAHYRDWRRMNRSFEDIGAHASAAMNLVSDGEAVRVLGAAVTANLFPILDVSPLHGRLFGADEDTEGAAGAVILSHGLWQSAFGGREDVVGRKVRLDEETYTVVGVMPANFTFPDRSSRFWVPMRFKATDFQDRTNHYLHLVGRLKRESSLEAARADMKLVSSQLKAEHPRENDVTIVELKDQVPAQARLMLTALFGASLCVLLIACTNLASLLIARSLQRRKELAVRTALGAGRERLVRQLMTESVTLAVFGGALGLALAAMATPLLSQLAPTNLPVADMAPIDLRVLGFAALITALTGVGFGVLPALRVSGDGSLAGLREGVRGGASGQRRLRSALVLAEVAISVVLLVSSGLLIRALYRVQQVDPGFEATDVLTLRTSLPMNRYGIVATRAQFYDRVLSEIRALPGVKSAAYASFLPLVMRGGIWDVKVPGQPEDPSENKVSMRFVTPQYFATLGIPLTRGRDFDASDSRFAPAATIVSESFARKYWPDQDPIGRIFDVTFQDRIVVGVAADVRVRGLERDSEPQVYLPYQQVADRAVPFYAPKDLAIKSNLEAAALLPSVREIIRRADPMVPISDVRTMTAIVEAETSSRATQLRILGAFAAIAIVLAGIGLHGLLAFTVSNRIQEIGVRIALGAARADILRLVVGDGVRLAASGVFFGLAAAYAASVSMEALLAGVSPADAPTFAATAALVGLMTLLGSLVPALRAIRVNPITVMRADS